MKNELTYTSPSGKKYLLKLADIWVKSSCWISAVDITEGEGQEAQHINILDEDQQDFRQGDGFEEFASKNPEFATLIQKALQEAAKQL